MLACLLQADLILHVTRDERRVAFGGGEGGRHHQSAVSVLDVLYRRREKKCTETDAADGDTASRLIGRAGKVGRLSGSGLAISKRPSI